jgi:ribosomal protein S18 acetylase RimI-like enzyme
MCARQPAEIRIARPEEYDAVAELTASVYLGDQLVAPDSPYIADLRDVATRARETDVMVAVEPGGGRLLGAVAFVLPGSVYSELAGEREAEFRMLVVDPAARRRGVGGALVRACITRARAVGATTLRLSTQTTMLAAHQLYERLGFRRTPERDWSPAPGVTLLAYALDLGAVYCDRCGEPVGGGRHRECERARTLEPPRWCPLCRRRLVVQVVPAGWTATCSHHGTSTG